MNRRGLALTAVIALLLALLLFWMRPGQAPPQAAARADVAEPSVREVRRPGLPQTNAEADAQPEVPETTPIPAAIRFDERLAAIRDQLHVRCFVGEEYSPVNGVEDGWFALNTDQRKGSQGLGDIHHDKMLVVRWSAPEGATQTTCTVDEPKWAYLTIQVTEEQGGPADGVGIAGCGVLHETGDDGRIEFPMLVTEKPCNLDVFRWASETNTHSQAFIRVSGLKENEERTLYAQLKDFERADDAPMIKFDWKALDRLQEDQSGVPEMLPDTTLDEEVVDYEGRLASTTEWIADLEQVLAQTPEDERWVVEEKLDKARRWRQDFEDHLDELDEKAEPTE